MSIRLYNTRFGGSSGVSAAEFQEVFTHVMWLHVVSISTVAENTSN